MKKLKLLSSLVLITSLIFGLYPDHTLAAINPPNVVTNIIVKQIGKEAVRISWSMPTTDATHDEVELYDVSIENIFSETDLDVNSIDVNGNLDIGVSYTVNIVAKNSQGSSSASETFTLSPYLEETVDNGGLIDPSDQKSSRSIAGHNMHGNYKNNTNTCANCHSIHQARSEEGLLTKSSAYESCISCHDGSLGFYNVFEENAENDNGAGTYGGSYNRNMSIHMPTGDFKIDTAPGSELAKASDGTVDSKFASGHWDKNFTCTSCHNPHGSSSDRMLQSSPNGYSRIPRQLVNGIYYGGLITDEIEVVGLSSSTGNLFNDINNTILNWGAPVEADGIVDLIPKDAPKKNYKALKFKFENSLKSSDARFNYKVLDESKQSWIIQIYRYDKYLGKWVPVKYESLSPYSGEGVDLLTAPNTNLSDWKLPVDSSNPQEGSKLAEGFITIGWYGYIVVPNDIVATITLLKNIATQFDFKLLDSTSSYSHTYTYKVDHEIMSSTQYDINSGDLTKVENAKKAMSNLNQFNEWCASCHIGFNISKVQKESSGSSVIYTHHVSSEDDQLPCVQCHYSHGTDAAWMKGADGLGLEELNAIMSPLADGAEFTTADGQKIINSSNESIRKSNILAYLEDKNGSSALKRYSNSTSCFRCHGNNIPNN
ncbi:MAG: doubled protein [Bacillales bacterium]|nr:doubled protein [Bacillales bacterium]